MTMQDRPNMAGLVLTGGASSRFGSPKANAVIAGASLGQIAVERLMQNCSVIAAAGPPGSLGNDVHYVSDPPAAPPGPLGGILAGLEWAEANSIGWLAVSPCDMPLLPPDTHARLQSAAIMAKAPLAMAEEEGGYCPLCAVWSTALAPAVRNQLAVGHPPVWRFAIELGAAILPLEDRACALNINERADLERAETQTSLHWWNATPR